MTNLELIVRIIAGAVAGMIVGSVLINMRLLKDVFDLKRKVEKLEKKLMEINHD